MLDGISSQPGTYLLIFHSARASSIKVGKLGQIELASGYYFYIGSAFGPGGVRARVRHHHGISQKPHWHLDYIRPLLSLQAICYSIDASRYEHEWANILSGELHMQAPSPGLGASDCRCHSHFFYTRSEPAQSSIISALKKNNKNLNLSIVEHI